jgi:hypothetical protein
MNEKVKVVWENLRIAQSRQKSYADNRRRELEFRGGDAVFFRSTPSRESLKHPKGGKLSPRYVGPFSILEWVRAVASRLDLLEGLIRIHDVFHVS